VRRSRMDTAYEMKLPRSIPVERNHREVSACSTEHHPRPPSMLFAVVGGRLQWESSKWSIAAISTASLGILAVHGLCV